MCAIILFIFIFRINKEVIIVGRNSLFLDIFLDFNKNKVMIFRFYVWIVIDKDSRGNYIFKILDISFNGIYVNDIKIVDFCDF